MMQQLGFEAERIHKGRVPEVITDGRKETDVAWVLQKGGLVHKD